MALKVLKDGNVQSEPQVGDMIKGYLVGVRNREAKTKDGRKFTSPDLVLKREDGSEMIVFPRGNLKYAQKDIIDAYGVKPGTWVEITCTRGGEKPRYDKVAVDDEKMITVDTKRDF